MHTSSPVPDQSKVRHSTQTSLATDALVSGGLVIAYLFVPSKSVFALSILGVWAMLYLVVRPELKKLFTEQHFAIIRSLHLTLIAGTISYLSEIPILLMILPVLIALAGQPSRYAIGIAISISLVDAFFLGHVDNVNLWIVFTISVLSGLILQNVVHNTSEKLDGAETSVFKFRSLSTDHFDFVKRISQNDYVTENPFGKDDNLGTSLYEMSLKFKKSAEEEKLHSWQMGGLNDIGAILRSTSDVSANYSKLISFLVRYLNANQGGLFTINNNDPHDIHVELNACYAYEKHKILQKKLGIESGLIGQCILEKEIVYIERIPENYVHITSGLGLATPRSLVLVPLKDGDDVVGVIEMASLQCFQKHELIFLEKAADIIGAAIHSFQNSIYTNKMLAESQQLAEDLKTQQEEVRQNMEELEATQEHLTREAKEREKLEAELNKSKEFLNLVLDSVPVPVFVKDRNHKMILVNKAVCDLNNMSKDEMIGKSDYDFFSKAEADVFWNFEEDIFIKRTAAEKVEHAIRNGKETYTLDKKLVVTTDDGEIFMVGINIDVTSTKMMEKQLQNGRSVEASMDHF